MIPINREPVNSIVRFSFESRHDKFDWDIRK